MPLFLSHCTANPSVNPPACSLNFRTEAEPPTSCHQQLHHPDHHHHDGLLKILPAPALALYSQGILHKKKSGHATLLLKASRISHLPQRKSLTWSSAPGLHDHYLLASFPSVLCPFHFSYICCSFNPISPAQISLPLLFMPWLRYLSEISLCTLCRTANPPP